ncbi:hypothetical protein H5410_061993 [Solanum commersonii]|uniref:Uncharacterized protein n=1 Tax=Solanum commersonii TaxID=4109 RepID=A0A9J5W973_SOLCO|nr:hypothetical protein H5410_061993 [Solanum commersonii]
MIDEASLEEIDESLASILSNKAFNSNDIKKFLLAVVGILALCKVKTYSQPATPLINYLLCLIFSVCSHQALLYQQSLTTKHEHSKTLGNGSARVLVQYKGMQVQELSGGTTRFLGIEISQEGA